jgi:hypothetical protein
MKWMSLAARVVLFFLCAGLTQAAEIRVISSDGFALVLDAVRSEYERASGNTVVIRYDVGNMLAKGSWAVRLSMSSSVRTR